MRPHGKRKGKSGATKRQMHNQDKKYGHKSVHTVRTKRVVKKSVSTININLKYNKISKKFILHLKFYLKSIKNSLETDSLQCAITGSLKLPHTLVYHLRVKNHSTVLLNKERKIFGTVLYYILLHKLSIDVAGWKIGFAVKEHMDQE